MSDLVVSLPSARLLKEAGWKQGTTDFRWSKRTGEWKVYYIQQAVFDWDNWLDAPCVCELLAEMPAWFGEGFPQKNLIIKKDTNEGQLKIGEKEKVVWGVWYYDWSYHEVIHSEYNYEGNLAEACALMYLWLHGEGLK